MTVSQIKLKNFRNYAQAEVKINSDLVLILGDNAAGKTNFLESIYFLSALESFRAPDQFLVQAGADFFSLEAQSSAAQLEAVVQVRPRLARQFKLDGVKTSRSLWRPFHTVLFVPNDLNLFTLGPALRRRFLDEILAQAHQDYALALVSVQHVLKQKSAVLEKLNQGLGEVSELDLWNQQLAPLSAIIYRYRHALAEFINREFSAIHRRMTNFPAEVKFVYKSRLAGLDASATVAELINHQEAEIRSGQNLIGPHRDDFSLAKNNQPNIYNSSRGELRRHVLTLQLLQAEYLSAGREQLVILLDDVFSELDELRRSQLIESLTGHQIFITSTEEHHLPKINDSSQILRVAGNSIK